ncbi:hypothetical protein GGX14DRAFT_482460 [Mycena pura]|uniref:Uncharacterized protein n=1 Tax=Mycena pura TaxID=153505 RepID=A0AAD6URQ4_9AGAR|nr:hypothetical protein GGX14DRAFT_482460 [Mycena pura]
MDATMSTSADTIRTLHGRPSPFHSPAPSPPDSPTLSASGSSISSFPSVSSSFFFSSAAASPPHGPVSTLAPPPIEETLIIPSLTLPAPLAHNPKPVGAITRLLVVGAPEAAAAALFVDSADVTDPSAWVDESGFRVLRTSTEWGGSGGDSDDHGSNSNSRGADRDGVELVALGHDIHNLDIGAIERRILSPFRAVAALLAPPLLSSAQEQELLMALLASPEAPLYTALLVVPPSTTPSSHSPESTFVSTSIIASSSSIASALDGSPTGPTLSPSTPNLAIAVEADLVTPAPAAPGPNPDVDETPDINIDIPERLQRLVPVLVLAPTVSSDHPHPRDPTPDALRPADADPHREHDHTVPDADAEEREANAGLPPPTARPPSLHLAELQHPHLPAHDVADSGGAVAHGAVRAYTPAALRRALRGPELRADAARRFAQWWRAGGGVDVQPDDPRPPHPGQGRESSDDGSSPSPSPTPSRPRRRRRMQQEKAPLSASVSSHRSLTQSSVALSVHLGARNPRPHIHAHVYAPYPDPYTHATHDPLHLPSLVALARDVVRAWRARGWGGGVGALGAFAAGLVLGVGVGTWIGATLH